jgi:hypothetical protein
MCDPVSLSIVGTVVSAGASLYEGQKAASELQATQDAQNKANAEWVAYQNKIHQEQSIAEQEGRRKATAAQQDTLGKVGPEAQAATQGSEQQRLNTLYNEKGGNQASDASNPANLTLSGEQSGNKGFMDSLTTQVNQATSAARQRIGALAKASSYGGSFGGLGTTVPIAFAQGGNDINLENAIRQGNLKTYGVEQQVQPLQYTVGPGTSSTQGIAKALGGIAGSLAGSAGPKIAGGAWSGAGDLTGVADASGGLTPSFTSAALTSFNDPMWSQWG